MEKVMFAEERQKKIILLLRSKKQVLVNELCEMFNVSAATIRTDLTLLEQQGYLQRTHGGAILLHSASYEMTTDEKESLHINEKIAIGEYAASLINDGDTIILDSGTTTMCLAEFLGDKKDVTVITNDIKIAAYLEHFDNIFTFIVGGKTRKGHYCSVGSFANNMLKSLKVDKAFISANAVDDSFVLSTPDSEQAEVKKSMMKAAKTKVFLCDSSKFNNYSLVGFSSLKDFDVIITDENIYQELYEQIDSLGKTFIRVKGE